ncbi:helix-turn-helix transcriptional regulator [Lachnospiraceae bacterium 47-T17]
MMNELLGGRIRELRSAKSFTQKQIAERIGVSKQRYARIENGANHIMLELLSKIAGALDITAGDITRVLDETPVVTYRAEDEHASADKIFEMIDLFYSK